MYGVLSPGKGRFQLTAHGFSRGSTFYFEFSPGTGCSKPGLASKALLPMDQTPAQGLTVIVSPFHGFQGVGARFPTAEAVG
jgi:hypothetical protein